MPRHVNRMPEMKLHKASGQAYVRLGGKFHYLGKHGSPESRILYERTIAEWLARDRRPTMNDPAGLSVSDMLAAFMAHAVRYYRAQGKPTGEADNFKEAVKPLFALYQDLPAAEFTTDELKAVRAKMIESGLARSTINARINRVRRIWKWAAKEKMLPASIYTELKTLDALLEGRTDAKESLPVESVDSDRIKAILSHIPSQVAAMIELQVLTGCRPGEVLAMRVGDIDQTCDPWEYRPSRHKNSYRQTKRSRVIPLGPKAKAIVAAYLAKRSKPDDHLFNPKDSIEEAIGKRKVFHRKSVKSFYDRRAYAQAIYRGCDRAFPHPTISKIKRSRTRKLNPAEEAELKAWRKKNRWSPLRVRHATATLIRKQFGLEAAQAMLGHAKMDTTEIYAERLIEMARKIAETNG